MINLKKIALKYPINMGAPEPIIVSVGFDLILLYYVDLFDLSDVTDKLKERDIGNDVGVAIMKFKKRCIHKFGAPNDEVIIGHPYYKLGLKPYSFFLINNSDWVNEIKRIENHHPYFDEQMFDNLNHFIITFKDNTFECIAEDYSIDYSIKTMKETFERVVKNINY
ncbi:hypothetical protein [Winogradskyella luteola]|uniref:Uncharacterized protein n=1 Tax=Winogradskyella luteola TaxID=2828330 RepID=A0A9X1FCY9_9FLAO|nr:hypothetical protein [Winogradskyella luteola]MBV7270723.1 hypothetical protein [Winogradskyella luteola]